MTSFLNQRPVAKTLAALTVSGIGVYTALACLGFRKPAFAEPPGLQKIFSRGPAFKYLQLHSSESVNHDTKRLRFELPGGEAAESGLSLTCQISVSSLVSDNVERKAVRANTGAISRASHILQAHWKLATSCATLYTSQQVKPSDEPGFIDLLVKHYPHGKASSHLHGLKPGDSLFILSALPGFSWTPNTFSHVYLIAGGAGITPIYQLVQGILDNPIDKTKVSVIFGVNTEEDLLLRSEFDDYKRRYPDRFEIHYTVSRPGRNFTPNEGVRLGKVTKELLSELMGGSKEQNAKIFVCGPPAMETSLVGSRASGQDILEQLGHSKDEIHRF